ncbi:AgmX/PglI C-terminal domain-containing protein [Hyalangium sp.]|uniref:AgmX/PglI C-terminal domain-containing protein n=1 Tax=Hyalangium sp. TaxID=2028555 RepID=UPI002D6A6D87|nr:AgmX/PglI C-terminal domain-containing protein [Hyalangium sp.]HYH97131.1 AgmX/PglI C-terminal domain-containing protein [Hyalangium sp.]
MVAGQELDAEQSEQQWLFRQGDLVLGPVSGQQLVEQLYSGGMSGDTLIAPPGERDFTRIGDVEIFKVHVARAVAKARVDADVRAQRQRALRKRLILGSIATAVTVGLGVGAWQLARWAAVHGPGGEEDEYAGITVDLPTIAVAQARKDDEELIAYPSSSPRPPPDKVATGEPKPKPPPGTPGTPGATTPTIPASAVAARTEKKPAGNVATDPDGLQMATEFDQDSINKVVKGNQKTLFRCLKEEAQRRPGFAAKVPIEFVIGNDGRVTRLWVDHPQLKQGPLYECFMTELKKWPFKPYKGELASVNLAFKVG